ncbi:tyrosine-type recombinase/integrase [Actinokineospora iranica]|uniref:Site-specific recombinase XerD n=1 Tax=Actinokineospora iranica TaxID=1271860 RepID=A0A1G6YX64_9PSEU|nr:tyrosine-type recombinase/integrase [Actinokineospora iranica]SDD94663.1 Site-specific recombinase XerD [Actinokineospora iranica]
MKTPYKYASGEWGSLASEWRRSLEADNKSANTVRIYLHVVRLLGDWANAQETPIAPTTIRPSDIRDYMVHLLGRTSAGNAHNNYRSLRTFFKWLVNEDEIDRSPMDKTRAPIVPEQSIPIVTIDQMRALLETCKGKDFADRRDTAILRVLWDTGSRRAEVSNLLLDDLDLETDSILVTGKGRRPRAIPVGAKTAQALHRYLRLRGRHKQAALPALWLGSTGKGALTHDGVKMMLLRRAEQAKVGHIHPHMFRHALAHYWQAEGGNETDLMRIMGWKSPEMLRRYGASAATERAHASHRSMRLGDRV